MIYVGRGKLRFLVLGVQTCQLWKARYKGGTCARSLAGMELIFFVAAGVMLCFTMVTKTELTAHRCFCCCWMVLAPHQGLLCSSLCPPENRWGAHKRLGGDTARQMRPNNHRDIPPDVMLSKKKGKERDLGKLLTNWLHTSLPIVPLPLGCLFFLSLFFHLFTY